MTNVTISGNEIALIPYSQEQLCNTLYIYMVSVNRRIATMNKAPGRITKKMDSFSEGDG
jgi:hypothetical protein